MNKKTKIYNELSRVLTDYENMECYEDALYEMLVKIQDNWDEITKGL